MGMKAVAPSNKDIADAEACVRFVQAELNALPVRSSKRKSFEVVLKAATRSLVKHKARQKNTKEYVPKICYEAVGLQISRKYMPQPTMPLAREEGGAPALIVDGCSHVQLTQDQHKELTSMLMDAQSACAVYQYTASLFECTPRRVLLYQHTGEIIRLWYSFCKNVNELLKSTGKGVYVGRKGYWEVAVTPESTDLLRQHLGLFFKVIVDAADVTVLVNDDQPLIEHVNSKKHTWPMYRRVTIGTPMLVLMASAYAESSGFVASMDTLSAGCVRVFNGTEFVPCSRYAVISTELDTLLLEIVQDYGASVYAKLNVAELETDSGGECIKGSERAFVFVSEDDQDIVGAVIEPRVGEAMLFGQTFIGA